MKKLVLSLFLTFSFASYIVYQRSGKAGEFPILTIPAPAAQQTNPQSPSTQTIISPRIRFGDDDEEGDFVPPQTPATPPTPVTNTPTPPTSTNGQYRNGQFTGSSADAYYGYVQVKTIISGGKITDVQFLNYPRDRNNSIRINNYALPILKSETIAAQNANVDAVSGATATSGAFVESLTSALAQAKQ